MGESDLRVFPCKSASGSPIAAPDEREKSADLAALGESVVRVFLKSSAQAADRGTRGKRNSADLAVIGESVLRVFHKSAQAADRGTRRKRKSADLAAMGEVLLVRVFLESAQAANRGTRRKREIGGPGRDGRESRQRPQAHRPPIMAPDERRKSADLAAIGGVRCARIP